MTEPAPRPGLALALSVVGLIVSPALCLGPDIVIGGDAMRTWIVDHDAWLPALTLVVLGVVAGLPGLLLGIRARRGGGGGLATAAVVVGALATLSGVIAGLGGYAIVTSTAK